MILEIVPAAARGSVQAPPSKSMAHRLLICAAFADGTSIIKNTGTSEDVLATEDCLRALGAHIAAVEARGGGSGEDTCRAAEVTGFDPFKAGSAVLPCRESGSTLRFLIPLSALSGSEMTLTGSGRLMERPLSVYEELFRESGITLEKRSGSVTIRGRLRGGSFEMDGGVSSQFVSGMLFALPLLAEDSVITLAPPIESRPYIDMTMAAMETFGVSASWKDDRSIYIPGGQRYEARDVTAEGDWSGAAFLLALGADVTGLDAGSLQGDRICEEHFEELRRGRPVIDISDCPDLGPVLMAYAAMHNGCTLTGTGRLRIKESDRGAAMEEELAKFGVSVIIHENSMDIGCGISTPRSQLSGHNDHRIVMALSVLSAKTGGVIDGAEAVGKSFPDFFEKLGEIGIITKEIRSS